MKMAVEKIGKADMLAASCIALMMMPLTILINGFVISTLWRWFIVPLGVVQIGMVWALGLSTILGYFKYNIATKLDIRQKELDFNPVAFILGEIMGYVMFAGFTLAFGYLFHRLM
jgi:uncharacterized membrane protein